MAATLPRSLVLSELRTWRPDFESALGAREPGDVVASVLDAVTTRATAIADTVADPGALAPHMRAFTTSGVLYVAVYLALRDRGYDAARTWDVCDAATRSRFARMKGLERAAASSGLFSWPMKALSRWIAKKSKAAPVGGWAFDFVEGGGGAGDIDYGVDYTRCAIRDLAIANGAADFAPYICLADVAGSDTFGWGLVRTETLAQGGARCDFRFKRGGPTDVKVRLPMAGR